MQRITENSPFPSGGKFWVGKTWGDVIRYYADYSAHSPFCDGFAYKDGGRLYLCHFGGRGDPTLRQVIPKALEAFTLAAFADAGGQIEDGRRYGALLPQQPKPGILPLPARAVDDPPNYPGGFHATEITVFLYHDGRMNFTITKDAEDCRYDWHSDPDTIECGRRCKALKAVNVAGLDWSGIVAAAEHAADQLRGCTWAEYRGPTFTVELTPEGEQTVIPGCERNDSPATIQLDLFG